ncbi:MAG: acyltransferase, partial [Gemmatimonadota bacterium]|nr:acyltransferase [Gemmatimonadota bacterium]
TNIGRNVYIGAYCTIGLCHLHDDVLLGSCVDVVSGKQVHFFDRTDIPIRKQGGQRLKLDIGPDAWVGNKAVLMASVGRGTVVGAGSIVTADCGEMGVYVGNPARRLKSREAGSLESSSEA